LARNFVFLYGEKANFSRLLPFTMKYIIPIVVLLSSIFYSCGSGGYDLEQVEGKDTLATKSGAQPVTPPETVSVPAPTILPEMGPFTIQIGAFQDESNALNQVEQAKNLLGTDVYYRLENGLFKVRVGEFADLRGALLAIGSIKDSGFPDAFIIRK
jgi:hypothetical protein